MKTVRIHAPTHGARVGDVIDVCDAEADWLCAYGYAVLVEHKPEPERVDAPEPAPDRGDASRRARSDRDPVARRESGCRRRRARFCRSTCDVWGMTPSPTFTHGSQPIIVRFETGMDTPPHTGPAYPNQEPKHRSPEGDGESRKPKIRRERGRPLAGVEKIHTRGPQVKLSDVKGEHMAKMGH